MFAWRGIKPAGIIAAIGYLNRAEESRDGPTITRLEPPVEVPVKREPTSGDSPTI
jgi:hypothetical protein